MTQRTLLQFFHWYYPDGGSLWKEVEDKAESLAAMGITDVWLPPAYKGASGGYSVGYDTNDLFDLGEFDQKGTVATKYGARAALERACQSLKITVCVSSMMLSSIIRWARTKKNVSTSGA